MVTKGHFSWYTFLNIWKCLLFAGDGFEGARSIDSAVLSLEHKTFLQMAHWFWRSIQLAASWMWCSLWETFFCFVDFVHTQNTSESKSAYFCLLRVHNVSKSGFGKFLRKSFCYSQEKIRKAVFVCCYCFINERIQNFWEAIHISGMPDWFLWLSWTNVVVL